MSADVVVDFYFDFISPYAYLGWQHAKALRSEGVVVRLRPVVFAGLLRAHGQLGPAEIPAKRRFVIRDCMRLASRLGVSFRFPATHPFRSIDALRLCLPEAGLSDVCGDEQEKVVDLLFNATWRHGLDVSNAAVLSRVLSAAGLPGDELMERTKAAEVKNALKTATADAIEAGVFGVPTFGVAGELVWGHDRMVDVLALLAGDDVIDPAQVAVFDAMPMGVVRRKQPRKHAESAAMSPVEERVRRIFGQARFVTSLGIKVTGVEAGIVRTEMVVTDTHTQQDGYVHAGALATLADHTAGGAAGTVMSEDRSPLSIEFKINMLRPARGPVLTCEAKVLVAGHRIVVAEAWVYGGDTRELVAKATVTLKAART